MPRSLVVRASLALAALAAGAPAAYAQAVARTADGAFLRHLHAGGAARLVAPLVPSTDLAADPTRASTGGRLLGDVLWVAGGGAALVTSLVLASPDGDGPKPAAVVVRPLPGSPPPVAPGPPGGSGLDKTAAPAAPPPPPAAPPSSPRVHVTPEPGTLLLLATGLAGAALVAGAARRRERLR